MNIDEARVKKGVIQSESTEQDQKYQSIIQKRISRKTDHISRKMEQRMCVP